MSVPATLFEGLVYCRGEGGTIEMPRTGNRRVFAREFADYRPLHGSGTRSQLG